jgi:hypothetical protein
VFDLGEHIAGDLIAAKLALRKTHFQPRLLQPLAQFHTFTPGNFYLPYYSTG